MDNRAKEKCGPDDKGIMDDTSRSLWRANICGIRLGKLRHVFLYSVLQQNSSCHESKHVKTTEMLLQRVKLV